MSRKQSPMGKVAVLGLLLLLPVLRGDDCSTDKPFYEAALPGLQNAMDDLARGLIDGWFAVLQADDEEQSDGLQDSPEDLQPG